MRTYLERSTVCAERKMEKNKERISVKNFFMAAVLF
jgi:hypothetical protein